MQGDVRVVRVPPRRGRQVQLFFPIRGEQSRGDRLGRQELLQILEGGRPREAEEPGQPQVLVELELRQLGEIQQLRAGLEVAKGTVFHQPGQSERGQQCG